MSVECPECERDARGPHDKNCSWRRRHKLQEKVREQKLRRDMEVKGMVLDPTRHPEHIELHCPGCFVFPGAARG